MIKEFRTFAIRGNVLDMAVGIIVGAAFGGIVTSLVNDILMPPIGLLLGRVDFANLFVTLKGGHYASLVQAKAAGATTINYGLFCNSVINFVIVAFAIFLVVREINSLRHQLVHGPDAPKTKECAYCISTIPFKATRCPNCTSELKPA